MVGVFFLLQLVCVFGIEVRGGFAELGFSFPRCCELNLTWG